MLKKSKYLFLGKYSLKMKHFFLTLLLFLSFTFYAQDYIISDIDQSFKAYANSTILNENTLITIEDIDAMTINYSSVVTVYNNVGLQQVGAYVHYSNSSKVKDLDLFIYSPLGEELEHFKKRDFKDQSAISGGTMYSDNRIYLLDYKPRSYPITVKFNYELKSENTAFIRPFKPLKRYFQSVKKSSFKIVNQTPIKLRYKTSNFEGYQIVKNGDYEFVAENILAVKRENYSSSLNSFLPSVKFALNEFNLEGVKGKANNWQEFGLWQYKHFLKDFDELPQPLVQTIKRLTAKAKSDKEKAKIIYNFMQENSRYISVQLGIGGWQPMEPEDVYEKKYGDCKALTNYTRAMLKAVGVDSDYCVVYSGNNKTDIDPDFFSMQGNHVILKVNAKEESYWLECTSQTQPFGFLGTFTDGRKVLAINESGGEIIETPRYENDDNLQVSNAVISFEQLDLIAEVNITSTGSQYDRKFSLNRLDDRSVRRHYQNYWKHINRLEIESYNFENDEQNIQFKENISLRAQNYLQQLGNDIILKINPFNQSSYAVNNYEKRFTPFNIPRGYKDVDYYTFNLGNYQLNLLPEPINFETKFGSYNLSFKLESNQLLVSRSISILKNDYKQDEYVEFVDFLKRIAEADQTKLILNTL